MHELVSYTSKSTIFTLDYFKRIVHNANRFFVIVMNNQSIIIATIIKSKINRNQTGINF